MNKFFVNVQRTSGETNKGNIRFFAEEGLNPSEYIDVSYRWIRLETLFSGRKKRAPATGCQHNERVRYMARFKNARSQKLQTWRTRLLDRVYYGVSCHRLWVVTFRNLGKLCTLQIVIGVLSFILLCEGVLTKDLLFLTLSCTWRRRAGGQPNTWANTIKVDLEPLTGPWVFGQAR